METFLVFDIKKNCFTYLIGYTAIVQENIKDKIRNKTAKIDKK